MYYFIIGVIIIVVLWVILIHNKFVKLTVRIDEAFATMDTYLKKRYDLVPNLVETVKGYATHEKEAFESVTIARSKAVNSGSIDESIKNENMLTSTLTHLFALSENYPQLKANENFLSLQNELSSIERDIAKSRAYYNAVIKTYNVAISIFPNLILAGLFKHNKRSMYEINKVERESVEVDFS